MAEEIVRVLRVIEYIGPREWVETTLRRSLQGEWRQGNKMIRVATLGSYPEILTNLPVDERQGVTDLHGTYTQE